MAEVTSTANTKEADKAPASTVSSEPATPVAANNESAKASTDQNKPANPQKVAEGTPAEAQSDVKDGKPVAAANDTASATNPNQENPQPDQAGGADQGSGGNSSSKSWIEETLKGKNSPMILAIGGGLLAFLFAGGGNIGSFVIAGIVALVAGTAGPDLMKNLFDDKPATPSPSNTPPEKLLNKDQLKKLTNYNRTLDNELDRHELEIIAALDEKAKLSNKDIQMAIGGDEETAKKVNALIASQLGIPQEKDGTIDLSKIGNLPVSVSLPTLEAAHKDAPTNGR